MAMQTHCDSGSGSVAMQTHCDSGSGSVAMQTHCDSGSGSVALLSAQLLQRIALKLK